MAIDWKTVLGWGDVQISELRFGAFSLLREGKYDKARLYFESLVVLDPTSAYDKETLGAIYLQQGDREKALLWFNRALQVDPHHEPTLLNKAKALLGLQRVPEAMSLLDNLEKSTTPVIAKDATALKLAYS